MLDATHEYANAAAAQICNLLAGDYPGGRAELYGRIYCLLVQMMFLASEEQAERWKHPSNN